MVAAACAMALAVLLGWEMADKRLRRRLAARPPSTEAEARGRGGVATPAGLAAVCLAACAGAGMVGGHRGVALALAASVAGTAGMILRGRGRRRRREEDARASVARATEVLAGMLRVGSVPAVALAAAAQEHPVLAEAGASQGVGGDVVGSLRRAAESPGREGLVELAAAWEVAQRTGASLCDTIEAVASELRRRQEAASTVRVELAATRAAGKVLVGLPAVGVLLGYGLGGDPVKFLTSNLLGEACLVLATVLSSAGLLWTDTLAARAAR